MKIEINQLIEFYSQADVSFDNVVSLQIPSGAIAKNAKTHEESGGLVIPLEGSACFSFGNTPYVISPGMVVHAGPGLPMDKEVVGSSTWRYAVIHYQIPEAQSASLPYYNTHFHIPIGSNPKLSGLLKKLTENFASDSSISALRCRTLFHSIIEEIVLSADRQSRESASDLMENAAAFMRENYSHRFSTADLAGQYGMDGKRFSKQFQKYIGVTPVRYLTELRIACAKELLGACDCPVMQVAACVGYEDPYYFSRVFKKITGCSPREYQTMKKLHL